MTRKPALLPELRSYIGLTDQDCALLARLRATAQPHFRAIADEFYAVIRMHEGAFAVLKDEAQVERLHASLQVWLSELLCGTYDDAYVERRVCIGQVHVRVGLAPRYVIAAMSRIRSALQQLATETYADDPATHAGTILAIARICDFDLAILLESYQEDLAGRAERVRARESRQLHLRLDERRRFLSDALEAAEVIVLGLDPSARLVYANRKAEEVTGYTADELMEGDSLRLLFGDNADDVRNRWLAVVHGARVEIESEVRTRAARTRIVRWHASAHCGSDARWVVVVGLDVTHERELERVARQNERLAAAGALAAGLAHEIRNPLNGASLHLSVLDRALSRMSEVPSAAHDALVVLRAEMKRLGALVSDFLEVARPKPLTRALCDVNEISASVETLLKPEAESRGVSLRLERCPFPAITSLDFERTKQVLVNLVRNALEAVAQAGNVTICVRRLPRCVELDVVDDGPGIADPKAPVFDAFFTTKERGTGLGLSIVHRIVADHGGDVTFQSRPGRTVFTVRFPADSAIASD